MEIMEIFADSRDVHQHKENPAKGERDSTVQNNWQIVD
jgi:hypothetical protein